MDLVEVRAGLASAALFLARYRLAEGDEAGAMRELHEAAALLAEPAAPRSTRGRPRGRAWYRDRVDLLVRLGRAARSVATDPAGPAVTVELVAARLNVGKRTLEAAIATEAIDWSLVKADARASRTKSEVGGLSADSAA